MGCDGISPKLLKHSALYQPLYHLFSLSISQFYIPKEWRTHLIKPIFKSGNKSSITNYRHISLLCVVSKVLEKLVYENIVEFVSKSASPYQFGFLRGRSSLQQLLLSFNTIFCSALQTDVIYLDFRKAFDTVAHNELLLKLWNFGICDNLWKWMRAYISNRVQCVSVYQSVSGLLPVLSGVPQGSILGPLLFLIFINDLPEAVSSSMMYLFADDSKCAIHISSLYDCLSLQDDLTRITQWSATWNLLLNDNKCTAVHFSTSQSPLLYNYTVNGKVIPFTSTHKDLGILVSSDQQWSNHYQLRHIKC